MMSPGRFTQRGLNA